LVEQQEDMAMKRNRLTAASLACIAVLLAASPAWAVSLSTTDPPEPVPDATAAPLALETWAAGSTTLVPLMAADQPARHANGAESPGADTSGVMGKPVDDIGFVKQASENGRKEVSAARDALPQLKNPRLREVAEMLVKDHSAANDRLSKLADAKGWPLPAPKAVPPADSGTASSDFDARWTADMIAGHEKSLALYRAQASNGEDKDLRRYASEMLPAIEHHLAELKELQK